MLSIHEPSKCVIKNTRSATAFIKIIKPLSFCKLLAKGLYLPIYNGPSGPVGIPSSIQTISNSIQKIVRKNV
jgi:hypothetical protein